MSNFWWWFIGGGFFQGLLMALVIRFAFPDDLIGMTTDILGADGHNSDMSSVALTYYSCIIFVRHLNVLTTF